MDLVSLFEDAAFNQLLRQKVSREGRLNDIGSVQAVHTIRANNRGLLFNKLIAFDKSIPISASQWSSVTLVLPSHL